MSGIYGYIRNPKLNSVFPNTKRLGLWNAAYGKEAFDEISKTYAVVGSYIEKLKNDAPRSAPVISRGSKLWVVDAIIYNREELFTLLNKAETYSDEELIIHLVEECGWDILSRVNGDFAGAVYDESNNSVELFRDHMGIRPLYYYAADGEVCFSTDIRGVLSVETVDAAISEVWAYNTYFDFIDYSDVSTEYEKIFCVRPASVLKISFCEKENDVAAKSTREKQCKVSLMNTWNIYRDSLKCTSLEEHKYWQLGAHRIHYKTEKEYVSKMRELVENSVKMRLDAFDGIAGAEFSGGLDSSLISILISRMGRECKYISWSMDPKDNPFQPVDERKTIEDICKKEGISCYYAGKTVDFSKGITFNENYSKVVDVETDRPFFEKYAFWPMINTGELFTSANYIHENGGKVVFTGHGGDEGVSHRTNPYEMWVYKEYKNYFDYFNYKLAGKKFRKLRTVKWGLSALYQSRQKVRNVKKQNKHATSYKDEYWQIIDKDFLERNRNIEPKDLNFCIDPLDFVLCGGSRVRLDNVAMYGAFNNVRYMFPYLDFRVIDYALSIERYMFLKKGSTRYILKQAFNDILPDSLLGEIDKSDPSFGGVAFKERILEEDIERLKKSIREYTDLYDTSLISNIFHVDSILEEIETKGINENNYDDLCKKCVRFMYVMKAVNAVEKARLLTRN